jgi:hypothetical protein
MQTLKEGSSPVPNRLRPSKRDPLAGMEPKNFAQDFLWSPKIVELKNSILNGRSLTLDKTRITNSPNEAVRIREN